MTALGHRVFNHQEPNERKYNEKCTSTFSDGVSSAYYYLPGSRLVLDGSARPKSRGAVPSRRRSATTGGAAAATAAAESAFASVGGGAGADEESAARAVMPSQAAEAGGSELRAGATQELEGATRS